MPGQPTPLCRCRVLYIGSAVPLKSKDGLQGIQEPLKQLYPADLSPNSPPVPPPQPAVSAEPKGVDAWLSVWINGLVLEYAGDNDKEQFFPIQTLHYCAAVRYVNVAGYALEGGGEKFLPLDSPFANLPDTVHPPIFAAILRRTQGVRVLECHAFICTNEKAANALVKCCFNAYADSMYLDMSNPENAQNGHTVETTESSLMGTIKEQSKFRNGVHDLDSLSPRSDDPDKSGYQDVADGSPRIEDDVTTTKSDTEKEQQKWSEAKAKYNWQQRQQQPGDYETASISSSLAGKYKKKEQKKEPSTPKMATLHQRRPPSVAASYSNALVPYGQPRQDETLVRRRTRSEIDLHAASRGAIMPFMPPPQMMPWPMFPPGPGGMMPPGGLMPPPPPGGFMPPPPPQGAFGPPPMFPGTMPRSMPPPFSPWGPLPPALTMPPSSKQKHKGKKKSKSKKHDSYSHLNAQYMPPPPPPQAMMFPMFRSFEEPPYLPGQMPPPHMQMRPAFEEFPPMMGPRGPFCPPQPGVGEIVYPYDNETPPAEDYIENYKSLKQQPQKVKKSRNEFDRRSIDESTTSSKHSFVGADYWENRNVYDGTLFRRQNLNEKAFGTSIVHPPAAGGRRTTYEERVHLAAEPTPDYNNYDVRQRSNGDDIENRFRNMDIKVQQERHGYSRY